MVEHRPTSNLATGAATSNGALPAKDLGHVIVVQGPGHLVSLVRIPEAGPVRCDCASYHATRQPCEHIAAAARLLWGAS